MNQELSRVISISGLVFVLNDGIFTVCFHVISQLFLLQSSGNAEYSTVKTKLLKSVSVAA